MPRYFFHVRNGEQHTDNSGLELRDEATARKEAIDAAGEMLRDLGVKLWEMASWEMVVTDENGTEICRLICSAK